MAKGKKSEFKGISLEQKWKDRTENNNYVGSKSGNKFITSVISYDGQPRFMEYSPDR